MRAVIEFLSTQAYTVSALTDWGVAAHAVDGMSAGESATTRRVATVRMRLSVSDSEGCLMRGSPKRDAPVATWMDTDPSGRIARVCDGHLRILQANSSQHSSMKDEVL
jgi:hypothetical protein